MRKLVLLLSALLLLGLLTGCGTGLVSNTPTQPPSPMPQPSPTQTEEATEPPEQGGEEAVLPSGEATCVADPFDFPVESRIPPVTDSDHVIGPDDATVTLIEYADFQ